jgi:twitching motility protein PilT
MLKLQDLELPATVAELVKEPRGLLIVTGASGQGKSTTIHALLQRLNETAAPRIITIEDPIEYLFEEDKCRFEQREVGVDAESLADGIRNAVRQDPEVIGIPCLRQGQSSKERFRCRKDEHPGSGRAASRRAVTLAKPLREAPKFSALPPQGPN